MSEEPLVRRRPDGRVRRPDLREPNCVHPFTWEPRTYQPASACRECSQGIELARWKAEWAAWAAENPDTYEARVHRGEIR